MTTNFKYPDGTAYHGLFDESGLRTGLGTITFGDKTCYKGTFERGLFSGQGVIEFPDGSSYAGEFWKGKFYGYGVFQRFDGMKYEGQFRDGEFQGYGLVTYADGSNGLPRKEGIFEQNVVKMVCSCPDHIDKAKEFAVKANNQRV